MSDCRIIPKKIVHIDIRLFEEEIEEAEFLALSMDLGYDQLFAKLVKEELERKLLFFSKTINFKKKVKNSNMKF